MKSILNEYKAIVGRGTDPVVIDPHVANIVKGVSGKYFMSTKFIEFYCFIMLKGWNNG